MISEAFKKGSIKKTKKAFKAQFNSNFWKKKTVSIVKRDYVVRRVNKRLNIKKPKVRMAYILFSYHLN